MDLNDDLLSTLKQKFNNKFNFYTTTGNELNQLEDKSIDLIFSMDSLVRVPNKTFILEYFYEFKRVLNKNGEVYIHLPCNSKISSVEKGFTSISKDQIINFSKIVNLTLIDFDEKTLSHGIMLHLKS